METLAIFSDGNLEDAVLEKLKERYTSVFFTGYSAYGERRDASYIHYGYIQHESNIHILFCDLNDMDIIIQDSHQKKYYLYNTEQKQYLDLYLKYIDGIVANEKQRLHLDAYNKELIYYV